MNSIDRCPLCGGTKEPGRTTFTVDLESCLVVVRKVPAKACRQCGESWIGEETARQLEGLVQKARRNRTEVEILHWPQAA